MFNWIFINNDNDKKKKKNEEPEESRAAISIQDNSNNHQITNKYTHISNPKTIENDSNDGNVTLLITFKGIWKTDRPPSTDQPKEDMSVHREITLPMSWKFNGIFHSYRMWCCVKLSHFCSIGSHFFYSLYNLC